MAQVILIYSNHDLPNGFEQFHKLIESLRAMGISTDASVIAVDNKQGETELLRAMSASQSPTKGRRKAAAAPAAPATNGTGEEKPTEPDATTTQLGQDSAAVHKETSTVDPLLDTPDDDLDEELTEGSLSGFEALEQGKAIVRRLPKALWQEIRQQLNISTFGSLPEDRGHELYKMAVAAAEKAGIRV